MHSNVSNCPPNVLFLKIILLPHPKIMAGYVLLFPNNHGGRFPLSSHLFFCFFLFPSLYKQLYLFKYCFMSVIAKGHHLCGHS